MPLGVSYVTGTNRSPLSAPPSSSQSASAATTARYASALAPPRNAQRNSPDAATVARRAPPPGERTITGRAAPRRASRAVSATTAELSPAGGRATSDTAAAGGSESHATPASVPASGDGSGGCTYQSPSWPRCVDHVSTAPFTGEGNRSSTAGSPTRTTRRAPATARATSVEETGVRPAASRHPVPSGPDCTRVRTGTRATSASVRARKRLSQSGGAASSTTEGCGLTSSTNQRASSRGSSSPTPSNPALTATHPVGRREAGIVRSVATIPLSGSSMRRDTRGRPCKRTTSVAPRLPSLATVRESFRDSRIPAVP